MKRIKICREKSKDINTALEDVNGKATRFTIRFWDDVVDIAERVEKKLEDSGVPKCVRVWRHNHNG